MKALLIVLCFAACTYACDPLQISFDLCNTDSFCKSSMYIDENGVDLTTFEFLYTRLLGNITYQVTFEAMLCNETTNNLTVPSNFEKLWIATMSKYRYCNHINQYFDGLVSKCICKADKLCKYTSANDEEFHFTDSMLFFIALLLIFLAALMFFIKRARSLFVLLTTLIELLMDRHSPQANFGVGFKE